MSDTAPIAPPSEASSPRAFVRMVTTPPALPWTQRQVALLDAQSGAPAPIETLFLVVQRVDGWTFRKPARFAVGYARRKDAPNGLTGDFACEGRWLALHFEPDAVRGRRLRRQLLGALAAVVAVILITAAFFVALQRRAAAEEGLEIAELRAHAARERALAAQRSEQEAAIFIREGLQGRSLAVALRDLGLIADKRAPDAQIQAVHWRPDVIAIETRGVARPLQSSVNVSEGSRAAVASRHVWALARPVHGR